jgi:hypothetical protein
MNEARLVGGDGGGHGRLEHLAALGGDRDLVRALVAQRGLALEMAARAQAADHVGQRAAIDAGDVHQPRLRRARVLIHGEEQKELLVCQLVGADRFGEQVDGALLRATDEVADEHLDFGAFSFRDGNGGHVKTLHKE